MMRLRRMSIVRGPLLFGSMVLILACGRSETMASKSAAAYREAQAKGVPVSGGHDHGAHDTATTAASTAAMDHSAHATPTGAGPHAGHDMTGGTATDHSAHGGAMSAADHAAMGHGATASAGHAQHGTSSRSAAGHEGHGATTPGSAGHDQHGTMQHGASPSTAADPHAQHRQPAAAPAHAGHAAMQASGGGIVAPKAPTTSTEIFRTQPAATLQTDDFDAPSAVSVAEAQKAAAGGGHQDHGNAQGASGETMYTCPMHPEVTSATPGTCPKCGMALVKKEK